MNSTTSINDLPTDPANGGSIGGDNMTFTANEKLDTTSDAMHQMVSELANASEGGGTDLMSRDIPTTTANVSQDPQVQPNYIDPVPNNDYIKEENKAEEIINNYEQPVKRDSDLDKMYEEMQIPVLIAVLYFLFQLPAFKKYLLNTFPVLFGTDGNINLNGYFFTSILFGLLYYILHKITHTFAKF